MDEAAPKKPTSAETPNVFDEILVLSDGLPFLEGGPLPDLGEIHRPYPEKVVMGEELHLDAVMDCRIIRYHFLRQRIKEHTAFVEMRKARLDAVMEQLDEIVWRTNRDLDRRGR